MTYKHAFLIGAAILLLSGFFLGGVGAVLRGGQPLVAVPEVHVPPDVIFTIGSFGVTNTLLSAWLTTVVILLVFGLGTRKMKMVPGRYQALVEMFIEWLYNFTKDSAGEKRGRVIFPLVSTLFIFVAFNAWMALIPIYPTVSIETAHGPAHILRSAATDINMPLALALISFVFVEGWGLRVHRFGYYREFIRLSSPMAFFIGLLEGLSHFTRIVSFTFRLFGNMMAGELVLFMITFLLIFIAPLAFYGLEILEGAVQGLIFMGLTLVFAVLAIGTQDGHEQEHRTVSAAGASDSPAHGDSRI